MKIITILITLIALLTLSITAHADEIERQRIVDAVKQHGIDEKGYLSGDGKSRYFATYDFGKDGGVDLKFKKSYLPAVTDGVNHDKTSKFRIPPSARKTAKYFAKGANHAMFLSMIIDVLGEGVDYVLDPKNNSIQYKNNKYDCRLDDKKFSSIEAVNKYHCEVLNKQKALGTRTNDNYLYYSDCSNTYTVFSCTVLQQETKVMNDEEFAQAVIELAKADNAKAKKVMIDVAKQAVSDGDYDKEIQKAVDELNADETKDDTQDNQDNTSDSSNASSSDSTNTDSQDDTQATPKPSDAQTDNNDGNDKDKFELPAFCDWATKVCEFIDWTQTDDNDKDTELDIPEPKTPTIDTNIRFNGQCPADMIISGNIFGQQISFTLFEWAKFCEILAMIKPIIIAMASYGAFKIVGGVNVAD